ncbi:PEGA domain-containing protein [Myxococcota bacterium]
MRNLFLTGLVSMAVWGVGADHTTASSGRANAIVSMVVSVSDLPREEVECDASQPMPCVVPGALTVATQPWTVVHIDDGVRGSTPLYKVRLLPGSHRVRFVNEAHNLDVTREVQVVGAKMTKVRVEFRQDPTLGQPVWASQRDDEALVDDCGLDLLTPAFLSAHATPWASVFLDGKHVGETPLYRKPLAPGSHEVRLVNEGASVEFIQMIDPIEGQTIKVVPGRRLDQRPDLDLLRHLPPLSNP